MAKRTTPAAQADKDITTQTAGEGANTPTPAITVPSPTDQAASAEPGDQQPGDAANSPEKEPTQGEDAADRSGGDEKEPVNPEEKNGNREEDEQEPETKGESGETETGNSDEKNGNREEDEPEPEADPDYEPIDPDSLTDEQKADAIEYTDELDDLLGRLIEQYPQEKAFHFTSDMQPFLDRSLADAKAHQKTIDPDTEVVTINVD